MSPQPPHLSPTKSLQSASIASSTLSSSSPTSTNLLSVPDVLERKSLSGKNRAKCSPKSTIVTLHITLKHSQLPPYMQDVLPDDYTYLFTSFEHLCEKTNAFQVTMFINAVRKWLNNGSVNMKIKQMSLTA